MRRLQCLLLATVAAIGFASVACAADMPMKAAPMVAPVAPYTWTGFYVGINGGGVLDGPVHDLHGSCEHG